MLVLASTALTVVIIVAAVAVVVVLALLLGGRTAGDEIRENLESDQGALGVGRVNPKDEELHERGGLYDEGRMDRLNE
jgi:hypothetical protein